MPIILISSSSKSSVSYAYLSPTSSHLLHPSPSVSESSSSSILDHDALTFLNSNLDDFDPSFDDGDDSSYTISTTSSSSSSSSSAQYQFGVAPGVLPDHDAGYGFDFRNEYSPKLSYIFKKYLKRPSILANDEMCSFEENQFSMYQANHELDIDGEDIATTFHQAGLNIEDYERANQEYLASDPRGLNFSAYVYVATLHSKYNEFVTEILKNK